MWRILFLQTKSCYRWCRVLLMCLIILILIFSTISFTANGENDNQIMITNKTNNSDASIRYDKKDFPYATERISIAGAFYKSQNDSEATVVEKFEDYTNLLEWKSQTGTVTYEVVVPKDAVYNISLIYRQLPCKGNPIRIGVRIDGQYPFEGMEALELPRLWKDSGDVRVDSMGNQFAPEQVELYQFQTQRLCDPKGVITNPYEIALTSGIHTITLEMKEEAFLLAELQLDIPENIVKYDTLKKQQETKNNYSGNPIRIEGESADVKTSRSMPALSDGREPSLSYSAFKRTGKNQSYPYKR